MKAVLSWSLLVCVLLGFAGCKAGIQVQDNYYDALGGQVVKVDDDFIYLGDCDPTVLTYSNHGRPKVSSGVKTRGDVFVKLKDGKAEEFVVFQRLMLTKTGWSWKPGGGVPVKFHGARFKEEYFKGNRADEETVDSYATFVESKGYQIDASRFAVRSLTRNVGSQSRVSIIYAAIPTNFPSTVYGNEKEELLYMRDRFERIASVSE